MSLEGMKKVLSIVGARPQFIKLAALSPVLRENFKECIVHTGQHYDVDMSKSFFDELNIPSPDYNLEVGSGKPCWQMGTIMMRLEEIVEKERPDCILVFGDTNSTAAASVVAAKCCVKLAHVEAGLREFNKSIPEETNKLITDALADFYFCPTETGVLNLSNMGIHHHVYNVGDIMIDLLVTHHKKIEKNSALLEKNGVEKGNYIFMTCHRAANTDNPSNLREILSVLSHVSLPVVFPVHPRTMNAIEQAGLSKLLDFPHVKIVSPMGYFETQTLIHHAAFVMTDSGGITKEAYFHRVQGILLDTQTEWVESVNEGWNIQCGPHKNEIIKAIQQMKRPTSYKSFLGDGSASKKIAEVLLREL